jgi:acyl carrier protein
MKKEKIVEFIIKTLKKVRPIKKISKNDIQNFNFIDSGHIDSFEIIKFNFGLEKKFKFKFTPKDLSLKKFKTISGLSDIIYKKISKKTK